MRAKPSAAVITVESDDEKVTGASSASFFFSVVSAGMVSRASVSVPRDRESRPNRSESMTSESAAAFFRARLRCASLLCGTSNSVSRNRNGIYKQFLNDFINPNLRLVGKITQFCLSTSE